MYKVMRNLSICLAFPFLLGSANLELTEQDIQNNRAYYEVINATSGQKIEKQLYAGKRVIQTHIATVLAIKEALGNQGIDPEKVRVLLYYDGLTISDSAPKRMWQTKSHPDTISSPWLDLTKTDTTSGETKITIRIDVTAARLLSDLYSDPEYKSKVDDFLSIPSIKQSCFSRMLNEYENYGLDKKLAVDKVRKIYGCVPEKLREPLLFLFRSSGLAILGNSSFFPWSVHNQMFLNFPNIQTMLQPIAKTKLNNIITSFILTLLFKDYKL